MRTRSVNYWMNQIQISAEKQNSNSKEPQTEEDLKNYGIAEVFFKKDNNQLKVA